LNFDVLFQSCEELLFHDPGYAHQVLVENSYDIDAGLNTKFVVSRLFYDTWIKCTHAEIFTLPLWKFFFSLARRPGMSKNLGFLAV
jgi:hypothetical protein